MPLPEHLQRLKQISIDTLDLSESTSALLKWYGVTSILDCIATFYTIVHERDAGNRWSNLFTPLFSEVKPALIAAGYWDLLLDADMWRTLKDYKHYLDDRMLYRKIVHWQGKDQNLDKIPLERLALSEVSPPVGFQFKSIGECLDYFIYTLRDDPDYWTAIDYYKDAESKSVFDKYMLGTVQPRLVEMGLWAFVEEHLDDFDTEEEVEFDWDEGWETFEVDDPPIHVVLMRFLSVPILIVAIGLRWIARALQQRLKR